MHLFFLELNNGQFYLDFDTTKLLLVRLPGNKYDGLKTDIAMAKRIWNNLKQNPQDNVIHLNRLKTYIVTPSNTSSRTRTKQSEESKIPQSGHKKCQKASKNTSKPCLASGKTKNLSRPQSQRQSPLRIHDRINELVKEKQLHYLKATELKKQKEETELNKCSFRPKTNPLKKPSPKRPIPGDKNYELYEMSKRIKRRQRKDKTTEDLVYERSKNECTFTPNISATSTRMVKSRLEQIPISPFQSEIEDSYRYVKVDGPKQSPYSHKSNAKSS